jgi:hypothetical protein
MSIEWAVGLGPVHLIGRCHYLSTQLMTNKTDGIQSLTGEDSYALTKSAVAFFYCLCMKNGPLGIKGNHFHIYQMIPTCVLS